MNKEEMISKLIRVEGVLLGLGEGLLESGLLKSAATAGVAANWTKDVREALKKEDR